MHSNFLKNSQVLPLRDESNLLASSIMAVLTVLPGGRAGGALLVVFLSGLAAFGLRRFPHPFFHISLALILAHAITFAPANPMDYRLMFLIPTLYGVAYASRTANCET
ncbi:MAG: hypothetical protein V2A34_01190 [Lentisphaerota bacterium]